MINVLDRMGNTPLHYATQMWSQSVVRMLLERGANIGMKVRRKMDARLRETKTWVHRTIALLAIYIQCVSSA